MMFELNFGIYAKTYSERLENREIMGNEVLKDFGGDYES